MGRITTDGSLRLYPLPDPLSMPNVITSGPDGALWSTQCMGDRVGRITVDGRLTEYDLEPGSYPIGITSILR